MRDTGAPSVGLDMRAVDPALFPNVVSVLRRSGIDPTRELVPVAPAAHYTMGGIATDLEGRATVPGLYAVGECACTGLHGANRLASNSLSECFVFGRRAALAGARRAAAARTARAGRRAAAPGAGADEPRGALAPRRDRARRRRPARRCWTTRTRSSGSSAPARWRARRAAGRTCGATSPSATPALDEHHTVVRAADAPVLEHWA